MRASNWSFGHENGIDLMTIAVSMLYTHRQRSGRTRIIEEERERGLTFRRRLHPFDTRDLGFSSFPFLRSRSRSFRSFPFPFPELPFHTHPFLLPSQSYSRSPEEVEAEEERKSSKSSIGEEVGSVESEENSKGKNGGR
jgi:hypothetical protein